MSAEEPRIVGSTAAIAAVWERLGLDVWFATQGADRGAELLSEAVFAFASRQQVLRHAGDVMCFDSAPDWGDDAVLTSTVIDPAKGLVAVTIEPGSRPIGESLDGAYDTTRLDGDDHWHGLRE